MMSNSHNMIRMGSNCESVMYLETKLDGGRDLHERPLEAE
jgi:hypothetical protein